MLAKVPLTVLSLDKCVMERRRRLSANADNGCEIHILDQPWKTENWFVIMLFLLLPIYAGLFVWLLPYSDPRFVPGLLGGLMTLGIYAFLKLRRRHEEQRQRPFATYEWTLNSLRLSRGMELTVSWETDIDGKNFEEPYKLIRVSVFCERTELDSGPDGPDMSEDLWREAFFIRDSDEIRCGDIRCLLPLDKPETKKYVMESPFKKKFGFGGETKHTIKWFVELYGWNWEGVTNKFQRTYEITVS